MHVEEKVAEVLDTSLTPDTFKKLSKSVLDISAISEMRGSPHLSRSTSNLMTAGADIKRLMSRKDKEKSVSKTKLIEDQDSMQLETIEVHLSPFFCPQKALLKWGSALELSFI